MPERVDVKPGEEWLVVTCHNHSCGRRILIDPVGPEMRDDEGDLIFPADTVLVICPHCELESLYQSDEIRCEQGQQRPRSKRGFHVKDMAANPTELAHVGRNRLFEIEDNRGASA